MLVLAAAVELAAAHDLLPPGRRMVWRSDNEGAVDAFNRRRANSHWMLTAMRQALEVMDRHGVRVYAEFIEGKKNTVDGSLSRGDPDKEMTIARALFGNEA